MKLSRFLGALAFSAQLGACSTAYTPKRQDHAYLVVETNKLALSKNGRTIPEDGPFAMLVQCDNNARDTAEIARRQIESGRNLATIAAVLNVFLGPGSLVGVPLVFMAQNDINHGYAGIVDAINLHNDAAACSAPKGNNT